MSALKSTPVAVEGDTRLAWELVAGIAPLPDILRRWTMTFDGLKEKLRDPLFRSMVNETRKIWKSELNTKERIRIKAQLLVEDSLLEIFQIVADKEVSPQARVDAFKNLANIGDLNEKEKNPQAAERVTININLGGDEPLKIVGDKT
jgi:hypothetical protein